MATLKAVQILSFILITVLNYTFGASVNATCHLLKFNIWTCNAIPYTIVQFNIPNGITSVHVKDFLLNSTSFEIHQILFQSDNWRLVKYLEFSENNGTNANEIIFGDDTFKSLQSLEILHIHTLDEVRFEEYSLLGLDNVRIIDVSNCKRLIFDDFVRALNVSDAIPNLEQLLLSQVGYLRRPMKIDRKFIDVYQRK